MEVSGFALILSVGAIVTTLSPRLRIGCQRLGQRDRGGTKATNVAHARLTYPRRRPGGRGCDYISDLILRSLRSKRLEGWTESADSRPSFETRAKARSSGRGPGYISQPRSLGRRWSPN